MMGSEAKTWLQSANVGTRSDAKLKARTTMDELGRTIKTETSEDGTTNYTISAQTKYFEYGRITMTSNAMRSTSAGADGWTRTTRDEIGRVLEVASFSGATAPDESGTNANWTGSVTTAYDGNQTTVTDQAGKQRSSIIDGMGRLIEVDEPNPSGGTFNTTYSYDPLGDLVSVNQGTQTRTFTYDSLSRLRTAKNPEQVNSSGTQVATTYSYDSNSNLLSKTNPNGTSMTFTYDGLNRVATKTLSTGGLYTYSYDTATKGVGKLASVSIGGTLGLQVANDGYYYDGYDAMGNVTAGHQMTGGVSYGMTYGYDLAGHMTQEGYPSGTTINTAFDAAGRISDVQKAGGTDYADTFTYAASGAVTAMTLGNNLVDHTSYNSRLQPTQIGLGTSATDSSVFKLDYGFGTSNNNGNVLSQTITVGAGGPTPVVLNQSYTYDALNRLQTAGETNNGATNWSRTFNYDRYGNMWVTAPIGIMPGQMTPQLQSDIDANTNRLSASGYDVSGNQITDQTSGTSGNSYGYDAENHMTSCTVSGQSSSYGYDATGNRVWKTVGTTSTVFVYNVSGQLVAEYGGPPPATTGTSYLTTDHLGSTRVITASDQSIRSRSDYLPFGEEIGAFGAGRSGAGGVAGYLSSTDIRQKFTSKERDTESNLDFFEARYFSSMQGRFTSPDEFTGGPDDLLDFADDASSNPTFYGDLTTPQSLSKYQYCYGNPLRYIDPNGHGPGKWLKEALNGAASALGEDNGFAKSDAPQNGFGRFVGHALAVVQGITEVVTGGEAAGAGASEAVITSPAASTGVGAIVPVAGAAVAVAGTVTVIHGGSVLVRTAGNIFKKSAGKQNAPVRTAERTPGGVSTGEELTDRQAQQRLARGGDVYTPSKAKAKSLQKKATRGAVHDEAHKPGYRPHYHGRNRQGGHAFHD